jgi:precorrin-3B C17-methyltransferase
VVGYSTYIDLIKPFLTGKETVATSMGKEIERVNRAIEMAATGKTVSLISSGDPGVYGMAGLASEILSQSCHEIAMEVIPGVPAAMAAAALLGAPLNTDVASISLSDHLLPWAGIVRRLYSAAKGDFIIALYNPKSKVRPQHLAKAREIILKHRKSSTPVGIVSNAYRPGQSVVITNLQKMLDQSVDMDTIIIIGNSTTIVSGNSMITPRGYSNKYSLNGKGRRK